jgi:beta-carotene 3-hydroxylase
MRWRREAAAAAAAFAVMEPVAYASHRWLMHGPGWGLHASHHEGRPRGFEANDWYPVGFAAATVVAMSVATSRRWRTVLAAGAGVTAYGAAYGVVHEIYAHRRVPALRKRFRTFETLGQRHLHHHRRGGEPFGMLAPVVIDRAAALRSPAAGDPLVEVGPL